MRISLFHCASRRPLLRLAWALGIVLAGAGCSSTVPKVDFAEVPAPKIAPATRSAPLPATGSLYHTASYRPVFEDRRARLVGDTLTIQIVENITASQKSTSTIDRTGSVGGSVTAFPFLKKTLTDKMTLGASTSNNFSGEGGTESANTFTGSITASVVDVLPNGHLVLTGEKQIGVNQNVDVLRFSGTVDPRAIQSGNIVSSTQVANARIESRGRGAQQEAQVMGWLARFFLTILPF
ncbi:MAG TPA: flagellar basal body L-ring protein FlgH [Burkholderiaceae bacterium]|nr:flagellar basal body L-ring protein FlgH [Burkholderiaceae bacterium]